MNIFVYSDESGVFDKVNNDYFVFGGLIIFGKSSKEEWSRRYSAAEKILRQSGKYKTGVELKATAIKNIDKGKLYRSLNGCYKFAGVINQKAILDRIFHTKKDKQRYLDYAYKIIVKRALQNLINKRIIIPHKIERIFFCVDEHTTATNGHYELKEGLEQEFRNGTFNYNYMNFFPPIFPKLKEINLQFCNSNSKLLIRASDIVANRAFYCAKKGLCESEDLKNLFVCHLP